MNDQELIADHDQIDILTVKLEQFAQADRIDSPAVFLLLNELSTLVSEHLHKEDSFVYPKLAASLDPANATCLTLEFEEIKRDWSFYLNAWQNGIAHDDWGAFKASTIDMVSRLRERVSKETGLLYGIAFREGLISMAPSRF